MKASRRQQLRSNELAEKLNQLVEFVNANSGAVLAGVAAVVIVIGLGFYWYTARASRQAQGWTDFYGTQLISSPDGKLNALRDVASRYKDPTLSTFAYLAYADGCMQQATAVNRTPEERQKFLSDAQQTYQTILKHFPDQLLAVAAAHLKLGVLAESSRQWDMARQHYQAVIQDDRFADMPQHEVAVEREAQLAQLAQPITFGPPTTTAPTTTQAASTKPVSEAIRTTTPPIQIEPSTQPSTQPGT